MFKYIKKILNNKIFIMRIIFPVSQFSENFCIIQRALDKIQLYMSKGEEF